MIEDMTLFTLRFELKRDVNDLISYLEEENIINKNNPGCFNFDLFLYANQYSYEDWDSAELNLIKVDWSPATLND